MRKAIRFAPTIFMAENDKIIDEVVANDYKYGFTTNIEQEFAAIGLSEETDAVVVMVSEETGKISIAKQGELITDFQGKDFSFVLKNIMQQRDEKKTIFYNWRHKHHEVK